MRSAVPVEEGKSVVCYASHILWHKSHKKALFEIINVFHAMQVYEDVPACLSLKVVPISLVVHGCLFVTLFIRS